MRSKSANAYGKELPRCIAQNTSSTCLRKIVTPTHNTYTKHQSKYLVNKLGTHINKVQYII